jgi:hypothetical protein
MKARFAVLSIILAGVLSAQPPRGFRGGGDSLTPPTAAELVQRKVAMLTKFLGLTTSPDQVTPVTGFVTTEQTCLAGASTNLKSAHDALVAAIKAGPGGIPTAVNNLSAAQAAEETCRATAAAEIYGILTGPQQTKLGNGLGLLMGGGGGPRMGPPPGH